MQKDELNRRLLQEELKLLQKATDTLQLSIDKCNQLIIKEEYSFEDMESFDSLTSKFGRTSDLFTKKTLRTIWLLLHESFAPFIDLLNKAEKMNLIQSADQLIEIRDLRNQITHEYIPEAITDLIPDVLENCVPLLENIKITIQFIKERKWY